MQAKRVDDPYHVVPLMSIPVFGQPIKSGPPGPHFILKLIFHDIYNYHVHVDNRKYFEAHNNTALINEKRCFNQWFWKILEDGGRGGGGGGGGGWGGATHRGGPISYKIKATSIAVVFDAKFCIL